MEKAKQVGSSSSSSSSSSFTVDLFGPKDSSKSPSSSTALFGSIFGPPTSLVPTKDSSRLDLEHAYGNTKRETTKDYKARKGNPTKKLDKNSSYENGAVDEPCYYNSSIYYGGRQEVYSPTTPTISPPHNFKKDGGANGDLNDNNSSSASRGNWWQGSLYY